jgi:hypothetical protein
MLSLIIAIHLLQALKGLIPLAAPSNKPLIFAFSPQMHFSSRKLQKQACHSIRLLLNSVA